MALRKYNEEQEKIILWGRIDGLDTTSYEDSKIHHLKMSEQYYAVKNGVDISPYIRDYTIEQLEQIRGSLEEKNDLVQYISPKMSVGQMLQIRDGLNRNLEVEKYADLNFDSQMMLQIKLSLLSDVDIFEYIDMGYKGDQIKQIRMGLEEEIDIYFCLQKEYDGKIMSRVRKIMGYPIEEEMKFIAHTMGKEMNVGDGCSIMEKYIEKNFTKNKNRKKKKR